MRSQQQYDELWTELSLHRSAICKCNDRALTSSGCFSGVPMMQSAKDRNLSDGPIFWRFDSSMYRAIFVECEMGADVVIVGNILTQNPQQMLLVEDDDVVLLPH